MNKAILKLLTLLGAGTATLVVTACYGPIPEKYQPVELDDVEECVDSVDITPQPMMTQEE